MRLETKNNILYRCVLDEGEERIEIPYSIEYIEADAFAEIPTGQLKHLILNYELKGFSSNAFRGIDKLETLTVYAYSF